MDSSAFVKEFIVTRNRVWTDEEVAYLVDNYEYNSINSIASHLNRGYGSVAYKANTLSLKRRYIYSCNLPFFDTWTEKLAYVCGIVLSDGHVDCNRHRVIIKMCDKDVINKIKEVSECTGNICIHHSVNKDSYSIEFGMKVWLFFRNILEFDNHKSYTAAYPKNIPNVYNNSFIRGIFDGDGWLYLKKSTGCPTVGIAGTLKIVSAIKNICGIQGSIYAKENIFILIYNGNFAINFLNYIYDNASIYMDRKYDKYLNVLELKNRR